MAVRSAVSRCWRSKHLVPVSLIKQFLFSVSGVSRSHPRQSNAHTRKGNRALTNSSEFSRKTNYQKLQHYLPPSKAHSRKNKNNTATSRHGQDPASGDYWRRSVRVAMRGCPGAEWGSCDDFWGEGSGWGEGMFSFFSSSSSLFFFFFWVVVVVVLWLWFG